MSGAAEFFVSLVDATATVLSFARGRDAPFGLDTAPVLPDEAAIANALTRLPDEIRGFRRTPSVPLEARYGGGTLLLVVIPVEEETGDAAAYITGLVADRDPGNPPLEMTDLEGDIYVLMAEEPHPVRIGRPAAVALWGRAGSRWAFGVCADTPEHREALMRAFAEASTADG